jgi:prepilin peptidase CpaA
MNTAVAVLSVTILAVIAYGDVRFRRIPNALSLAIAVLGVGRLLLVDDEVATGYTLASGLATFAITFLLFWRHVIGGGDAKLITAMALLIGHEQLLNFLFLMSISGGLLALVVFAHDKVNRTLGRVWPLAAGPSHCVTGASVHGGEKTTVPYGVAVAAAGAITLMMAR